MKAFAAACLFWSIAASAQTMALLPGGRSPVAEPLVIVAPEYPLRVLREKQHVEVRIDGKVTAGGRFVASRYSSGEGEEGFAQAIRAVLDDWRFIPAIEGCRAADADAILYVWFDMKDGRPAISATLDKPGAARVKAAGEPMPNASIRLKSMPAIDYPTSLWFREIEGSVIALVKTGAAGEVSDATVLVSMRDDGFNEAVASALRQAKFELLDAAAFRDGGGACVKVDKNFCLKGGGRGFTNPRCRQGGRTRGGALDWY